MALTPDMKTSLALQIALVVYLLVGILAAVIMGTADIFAVGSLVFAVPYLLFVVYGRRGASWAYLSSAILSAALIVVTGATLQSGMSDLLIWETTLATLLFALISVEGYKSYSQLKTPTP